MVHQKIDDELPNPIVDVIIPCYNYSGAVTRAIESVRKQTVTNLACYIVDDGSTDNTREVVEEAIKNDRRFHYVYKENSGVANARNAGVFAGTGKYVCCLDADDAIAPQYLEACITYMEKHTEISVAYTGLWYIKEDGSEGLSAWPGEFNYDKQVQGHNQIPTCNVARREVWERLGGQRQRYAPDGAGEEDAEMWLRAGAYGFVARKVTDAGLFLYSWMSGRVSGNKDHKMTNYRSYHPWTEDREPPVVSIATPNRYSHPARQYDEPVVSVVIPVGAGHSEYLIDALDSLESQTYRNWEVVVVDDTREVGDDAAQFGEISKIIKRTYPYVKYIKNDGKRGAGASRNLGASIARGHFLTFLDADDWLHPDALEKMIIGWEAQPSIIYTDHFGKAYMSQEDAAKLGDRLIAYNQKTQNALFIHGWKPYDCNRAQKQPDLSDMYHWCLVTTLVPKAWHIEVGGFDEDMNSWEDFDYYIRLAKNGRCFTRIPENLVVYRYYTGSRREDGLHQYDKLVKYMRKKYEAIDNMPCNCSGQTAVRVSQQQAPIQEGTRNLVSSPDSDFVLVVYTHPNRGQHRVIGAVSSIDYGYRAGGDKFIVSKKDIQAQNHLFEIVQQVQVVVTEETTNPPVDISDQAVVFDFQTIDGVTPAVKNEILGKGISTLEQLLGLGIDGMKSIRGIGDRRAEMIFESATLALEKMGA